MHVPCDGKWSCRGGEGSKVGGSWDGDFTWAVRAFPSILLAMQHKGMIWYRLRRETRRAAWKCVAVWKFQHFPQPKMSGEINECFPLTQLQDNLHFEIFEHRGKRKKKNHTNPPSLPFIFLSKQHLAEVAWIGSAHCLSCCGITLPPAGKKDALTCNCWWQCESVDLAGKKCRWWGEDK